MRKWITIIRHTTHYYGWTEDEEDTVRKCMEDKHQQYHWSDIAVKIYSEGHSPVLRTCKDIREHWNNHMNPSLKKYVFSHLEVTGQNQKISNFCTWSDKKERNGP